MKEKLKARIDELNQLLAQTKSSWEGLTQAVKQAEANYNVQHGAKAEAERLLAELEGAEEKKEASEG